MKYIVLITILLHCACSSDNYSPLVYDRKLQSLNIEVLEDDLEGCGSVLSFNKKEFDKRRYIFIENTGSEPFMKIDGKVVYPKLVKSLLKHGDLKIGDKSVYFYTIDDDIKMEIEWTIKWLCPPDNEACEITLYDAKMTLINRSNQKVYNLFGAIGC